MNNLHVDDLLTDYDTHLVEDLFVKRFDHRIFHPNLTGINARTQLQTKIDEWKATGKTVFLLHGCYDMLHPGHYINLVISKHVASKIAQQGSSSRTTEEALGSEVALILSLDDDRGIQLNTDKVASKIRPFDEFLVRSYRVLALCDICSQTASPIIDAITVHDNSAVHGERNIPLLDLAAELRGVDYWFISTETPQLLSSAICGTNLPRIVETKRFTISDASMLSKDWSTTAAMLNIADRIAEKYQL